MQTVNGMFSFPQIKLSVESNIISNCPVQCTKITICSDRILTFGMRSIHSPVKVGLVIIKL